ncbi:MAG: Zn-ribbon domain-containing OB-fold protein [Pseudonocardia sp.]
MANPTDGLPGTRCPDCDRSFYPARDLCPTCYRSGLEPVAIPSPGVLATWTVVRTGKRFPTPYALCYADFPGDVRVLGRVLDWREGMALRPGMTVHAHAAGGEHAGHTFTVEAT